MGGSHGGGYNREHVIVTIVAIHRTLPELALDEIPH